MRLKLTILFVLSTTFLFAQKKDKNRYHENLAKVEPTYTHNLDSLLIIEDTVKTSLNIEFSITSEMDTIMDSIAVINKGIRFVKGYKVLTYSGSSQQEGLEIRRQILLAFSKTDDFKNEEVKLIWHQPSYRVYVGKYKKRLHAVRVAEFLKSCEFDYSKQDLNIRPLVVPSNLPIRE